MLSFLFTPRYDLCLAHSIVRLSLQCSSLPTLRGSLAAGWEHYLLRPCCCLIINLAQTDPRLAIFSMLDVCWEAFFPLALLLFWIFGMTSAKIFQANSEARHEKLEWFIHVKSFWLLLEQLKRFCDLGHKRVRCQGKSFVFWSLQKTPKHD